MFRSNLFVGQLHRRGSALGRPRTTRLTGLESLEPRVVMSAAPVLDAGLDVQLIQADLSSAPTSKNATVFIGETATSYTFKLSDFVYKDEDGDPFVAVFIWVPPLAGQLTLDGVDVAQFELIQVADISAGKFKYVPPTVEVDSKLAEFQFAVVDDSLTNPLSQAYSFSLYRNTPDAKFAHAVFVDVLGRQPRSGGLAHWVDMLDQNATREEVAEAIWKTDEHRSLQIDAYFQQFLKRAPTVAGRQLWVNRMLAGATEEEIMAAFLTLPEYNLKYSANQAWAQAAFTDVMGRQPTLAGRTNWTQKIADGTSRADAAAELINQPERNRNIVKQYYLDFLGREPKTEGLNYWAGLLQDGVINQGELAILLLSSDEFFAQAQV